MKRTVVCAVFVLFLGLSALAQDSVTVISIKANLRGTPATNGIVVTTVDQGETFELIKDKSPWYLVQTPKYVGWIHGNSIRVDEAWRSALTRPITVTRDNDTPRTTTKPLTGTAEDSPFREEYVGGDTSVINISNSSNRTMNLDFGGARYVLANGEKKTLEVSGGNYEFTASAPGVRSKTGVREFKKGSSYTWDFFVITVRR